MPWAEGSSEDSGTWGSGAEGDKAEHFQSETASEPLPSPPSPVSQSINHAFENWHPYPEWRGRAPAKALVWGGTHSKPLFIGTGSPPLELVPPIHRPLDRFKLVLERTEETQKSEAWRGRGVSEGERGLLPGKRQEGRCAFLDTTQQFSRLPARGGKMVVEETGTVLLSQSSVLWMSQWQ